jgi:hypothetical protein
VAEFNKDLVARVGAIAGIVLTTAVAEANPDATPREMYELYCAALDFLKKMADEIIADMESAER